MLQIQIPKIQQSVHSSCATDSMETDVDHQENSEGCRDLPRCAKTVFVIHEITKIVELSFMNEIVEVRVVMQGRGARDSDA